ncbi:hypothetical protein LHGZ1_1087 [Laribacter hongkongensis]|uniref:Uncharacterized protein n=1 Tax=Laribacter hongkongensis TaxID=168471 RepID=A0A248LGL0_9NEIS|nr:hypothetical protein LHGZ1_1087 [Laribacter hongkongensis]
MIRPASSPRHWPLPGSRPQQLPHKPGKPPTGTSATHDHRRLAGSKAARTRPAAPGRTDASKPFPGIRACQTETGPTPANHGSRMLTRLPHLLPGIDARPDAAADRAMPPFRHSAAARRPA